MKTVALAFVELLENCSAPSTGHTMGAPITNLTCDRYDLTFLPEVGCVSAMLKSVTGDVPAAEMLYPLGTVRSMCVLPEQEQPASRPPASKRHKVKVEPDEVVPSFLRDDE